MAAALGVFLGYFFFSWLRVANDRFNHSSAVIQILLTMCAAYWSFVLAEGVLKMSGVLATVACSLVLAHHMWPHVVDREAMIDFWHVMEHLGNIIIFVLGGALVGAAMVHIDPVDYINLIVIYVVLTVMRGALIFLSRPILKMLHRDKNPVTWEEATVMTWGGLRGAVGLALAMQVNRGKAADTLGVERITQTDADRVLFFVAGIAFMTTCVNASTCPALVTWLGITALPEAERKMLEKFNQQMVHFSMENENPPEVTMELEKLLSHIAYEITHASQGKAKRKNANQIRKEEEEMQKVGEIVESYRQCVLELGHIPEKEKQKLDNLPFDLLDPSDIEKMIDLVKCKTPDKDITRTVNKCFLNMVNTNYWQQIEEGELRPGSDEAELLFTSVRFSTLKLDLVDIDFLTQLLDRTPGVARVSGYVESNVEDLDDSKLRDKTVIEKPKSSLGQFVSSGPFHISCAVAIIVNVAYVCLEELIRKDDNKDNLAWVSMEALFTALFFSEFVLKFAYYHCAYFKEAWNCFDFFLVVLGFGGLIMSIMAMDSSNKATEGSSESRVIRIARVLRTMRFLRLFRLFHARLSADKHISVEVASTMKAMQTLKSFVRAHIESQTLLMKYFARDMNEVNEVELCRCLLQSQVAVHSASIAAIRVNRRDYALFEDIKKAKQRKHIVESLEHFIEEANEVGAISNTNAGSLLHPLYHEVSDAIAYINQRSEGLTEIPKLHDIGDHIVVHGHHIHIEQDTPDAEEAVEEEVEEEKTPAPKPVSISVVAPEERTGGGGSPDAAAGAHAGRISPPPGTIQAAVQGSSEERRPSKDMDDAKTRKSKAKGKGKPKAKKNKENNPDGEGWPAADGDDFQSDVEVEVSEEKQGANQPLLRDTTPENQELLAEAAGAAVPPVLAVPGDGTAKETVDEGTPGKKVFKVKKKGFKKTSAMPEDEDAKKVTPSDSTGRVSSK